MVYSHYKINQLGGGWYVVFKDNSVITEPEMPWAKVPNKKDIKIMGLKRFNKHYEIEGKDNYMAPGETHMREIAINNGEGLMRTKQTLVGWFIGFYSPEGKNYWRVDAINGNFIKEVVPYE